MWDRVDRGAIQTFPYSELQVLALCLVLAWMQDVQALLDVPDSLSNRRNPGEFQSAAEFLGVLRLRRVALQPSLPNWR